MENIFNIPGAVGNEMYQFAVKIWPINRSLTGDGVRETLSEVKNLIPELAIKRVASGTKVYDWNVPQEWNIQEAWIKGPDGAIIVDYKVNNLHVVGYSAPVNMHLSLEQLQFHLHSLPKSPKAIPYVTSYYSETWGFCLTQELRNSLKEGIYQVFIASKFTSGFLNYGELIIKGETNEEILISTYICHPSMANNEISGITVTTHLACNLQKLKNRKYTYRILFLPETIGSITYIHKHINTLKRNVIAGFVITCVGDNRTHSFLPSRKGHTIADKIGKHVLSHIDRNYKIYSWRDRGSDERQYCSPGVDLPVVTLSRSLYGTYPEYHTSLDNLELISPIGLEGGYKAIWYALMCLELNCISKVKMLCEPQLGKRGLYPSISDNDTINVVSLTMDIITYSDGSNSLLDIAEILEKPFWEVYQKTLELVDKDVIEIQ